MALSPLGAAALGYAARGWAVFPLHTAVEGRCSCPKPDCDSPAKHPRTEYGLSDASDDPAQITWWWTKWPDANLGVRTGAISGLVVVDVDPRHGGDESLQDLESRTGKLPDTVEVVTGGGGRHFYFAHPGTNIRNATELRGLRGLDLRGDGGYVVAPPSLHASGQRYEWEGSSRPEDTALAPFPVAMLLELRAVPETRSSSTLDDVSRIPEGRRNAALTSLAGRLRRIGLSADEMSATLEVANATRCVPPLPEGEVRAIAESVSRYEPEIIAAPEGLGTQTFAQLVASSTVEPPRQMIEGHLNEGDVALLYGYSGVGKSSIALDAGICMRRGEKFLDMFATTACNVGVIDEESDPRRLGRRLAQLARARGIDPTDERMPVFTVGGGARLDTDEGVESIYAWVAKHDLAVVIIDTLRRVHRLRENEADDMAKIENAIKRLQRRVRSELGHALTVVLIHHSPKPREGTNASETMARGSSDIFAGVDMAIYIRKGRERGQLVVEQAKNRWGEPLQPYTLEIEGDDEQLGLRHGGSVEEKVALQQRAEELVLTILRESGEAREKAEITKQGNTANISTSTMQRALKDLAARGDLIAGTVARKRTYALTEAGLLR